MPLYSTHLSCSSGSSNLSLRWDISGLREKWTYRAHWKKNTHLLQYYFPLKFANALVCLPLFSFQRMYGYSWWNRFAPLRHPIPSEERCAGKMVQKEMSSGRENTDATCWSDCGTNFIGAQGYLEEVMQDWDMPRIQRVLSEEFSCDFKCNWNIPHASH